MRLPGPPNGGTALRTLLIHRGGHRVGPTRLMRWFWVWRLSAVLQGRPYSECRKKSTDNHDEERKHNQAGYRPRQPVGPDGPRKKE